MKRGICLSACLVLLASLASLPAEAGRHRAFRTVAPTTSEPAPSPSLPAPDDALPLMPSIAGLADEMTPGETQALMTHPDDAVAGPMARVIHFLGLEEGQVEQLIQLLQLRHETVAPLVQGIVEREHQLRELLHGDVEPDPAEVGQLVIEIRSLYRDIAAAQMQFVAGFQDLLGPDQQQRMQAIRLAAELVPLLPAFRALGLI